MSLLFESRRGVLQISYHKFYLPLSQTRSTMRVLKFQKFCTYSFSLLLKFFSKISTDITFQTLNHCLWWYKEHIEHQYHFSERFFFFTNEHNNFRWWQKFMVHHYFSCRQFRFSPLWNSDTMVNIAFTRQFITIHISQAPVNVNCGTILYFSKTVPAICFSFLSMIEFIKTERRGDTVLTCKCHALNIYLKIYIINCFDSIKFVFCPFYIV